MMELFWRFVVWVCSWRVGEEVPVKDTKDIDKLFYFAVRQLGRAWIACRRVGYDNVSSCLVWAAEAVKRIRELLWR